MLGSNKSADDLIPKFNEPGERVPNCVKIAGLSGVAGAQVTKGGRYRGK